MQKECVTIVTIQLGGQGWPISVNILKEETMPKVCARIATLAFIIKIKERNFNLAIIAIEIYDLQKTGFDIAEVIRILHPNTKIILVSENPFENNFETFTKRGYNGFLLNSDELQEFITSIKNVCFCLLLS